MVSYYMKEVLKCLVIYIGSKTRYAVVFSYARDTPHGGDTIIGCSHQMPHEMDVFQGRRNTTHRFPVIPYLDVPGS